MKIQVFGARGMLGEAVCQEIFDSGDEVLPTYTRLEVVNRHSIHAPVVINCAGLIKHKLPTDSEMILANAYGPHRLAETCNLVNARLIHVSTDCVFSSEGPHDEGDRPSPIGIYGLSKWLGETYSLSSRLTIRTSFIGWNHGVLHDMYTRESVVAGDRLLWSGHTVVAVAKILVELCKRPDITGLLHIPGEFQSRYELATKIKQVFKLKANVIKASDKVEDRRLVSIRWHDLGLKKIPSFEEQLERMRGEDGVIGER